MTKNSNIRQESIKEWAIKLVIASILAAAFTTFFTWLYESRKTAENQSTSAAIFYYDMNDSLEMINTDTNNQIFHNQFTLIDENKFYDYLGSIRGNVSEENFKNMKIYYKNIFILESFRQKYWESKDTAEKLLYENNYNGAINILRSLYQKDTQGFKNTLSDLKSIGNVKS